jgi:hypothetical protein
MEAIHCLATSRVALAQLKKANLSKAKTWGIELKRHCLSQTLNSILICTSQSSSFFWVFRGGNVRVRMGIVFVGVILSISSLSSGFEACPRIAPPLK